MPHVGVYPVTGHPSGPAWCVSCSRCGVLPYLWVTPVVAAFNAMGHGAVHAGASIRP